MGFLDKLFKKTKNDSLEAREEIFNQALTLGDFNSLCTLFEKNYEHDILWDVFYNTGNIAVREYDNHELAIKLYKKSASYNPSFISNYNNIASSYKYLWDIESAEEYYKKALAIDPSYNIAYLRLAMLMAYAVTLHENYADRLNEALDYYNKYIVHGNESEAVMTMDRTELGGHELARIIIEAGAGEKLLAATKNLLDRGLL